MKSLNSIYKPLIILLVAGLLAGCNKLRPDSTDIRFSVSEAWQLGSKSLANTESDLQSKSFSVLGKYSSGDTYNASATSTVFENQEVSYDSTNGWDYSPKQNWQRNATYRFCAYWPTTSGVSLSGNLDETININGFQQNNMSADQIDLLLSTVVETTVVDPNQAASSGVSFDFHHLLCNVKVSVKKQGESDIKVTSVQLVNVPNTGSLATRYSDWDDTPFSGTWTVNIADRAEYDSGSTNVTLNNSDFTLISDDGFLVIPQTVNATGTSDTDKVLVRVRFDSTVDGKTSSKYYEAPIPDNSQWQMFKKITYQLTIDENNYIKFGTPIVASWGTAEASGTIIIR